VTTNIFTDAKKILKEARMKKLVLVLLAVFLVIPALSNAGSVSSRYDVTFGGFVKFDGGWASQNTNADPYIASRESSTGKQYLADEYGNTFMTGAESRLNFLVKGPDLWGAKTSAFIEGDFRGVSTGNQYGGFQLRHAFMTLNWERAELMIGQNWQQWGMPYYPAALGFNDNSTFLKGLRMPQIAFRYFFTKEFNAMIGVQSATDWSGSFATRGSNDDYARSNWPGIMGEIAYWSDRCGKIGPNNLKFGLGGFYGREKKIYNVAGTIDPSTAVQYFDDETDAWMAAFRYSVPIIPEKQGNKQYALLLNGNVFYGQNWSGNDWQNVPGTSNLGSSFTTVSGGSYLRPNGDAAAPTAWGQFAQLSFWFTNNFWTNLQYGYLKYNYSANMHAALPNQVDNVQNYAVNLMWDANQAIRFGIQWNRLYTRYNDASGVAFDDKSGKMDIYRVAAWYFF
jgi:hypothetical protein